jgi:hypothetical protein
MATYNVYTASKVYLRAVAKIGKSNGVGWCMRECANLYGGLLDYDYDKDGHVTALDYWKASKAKGKVVSITSAKDYDKIPLGALVFWDTHYGHVAIYAGNGYVISTDRPSNGRWGLVTIDSICRAWGKKFLGYVEIDWQGKILTDKPVETVRVDKVRYVSAAVLNGRKAPVNGEVVYKREQGYKIHTVAETPDHAWAVTAYGTWYATAYLADTPPLPDTPPVKPPVKSLRVLFWNVKAPELTVTGTHKWSSRRTGLRQRINAAHADIVALTETGSGVYLTWWKSALKAYGLTWFPKGSKWQNIWRAGTATAVASGLFSLPKAATLNGDNKEMAWAVFEFNDQKWLIGDGHPENENGKDKKSGLTGEQIRLAQVKAYLAELHRLSGIYNVPDERVILVTDDNSPSGNVRRWVHENTAYRDAFFQTENTVNKYIASNNKWQPRRPVEYGVDERIDLVFVHKDAVVERAENVIDHTLSDHNRQIVNLSA